MVLSYIQKIKTYAAGLIQNGLLFREDISSINIKRIRYVVMVMLAVHVSVIFFLLQSIRNTARYDWNRSLVLAHLLMFILSLAAVFFINGIARRDQTKGRPAFYLQIILSLAYLLFGAAISTIDQLVFPNINAFLIACIATAMIIIMNPVFVIINYTIAMVFFYQIVALTQSNAEMLLSVRINGITATGIAAGLALVLWSANIIQIRQHKIIEAQNNDLETAHEIIKQMAFYDSLTNLPNRRLLQEIGVQAIKNAQRDGKKLALLFVDLIAFKKINDTYGHEAGDQILVKVSARLKHALRESDTVARLGGDEFIILLPDIASATDAIIAAGRITEALGQPVEHNGNRILVGASIGASIYPDHGPDLPELIRKADNAMYVAKNTGSSHYHLYGNTDVN